jgi:ribose transport system permease protein
MKTDRAKQLAKDGLVYIILLVLTALFSLMNSNFLSVENFFVIGRQTAIVGIISFGMTFVITAAEIDLSVGSIVGLVGMASTMILQANYGIFLSSLAGAALGAIFGFANGVFVAKLRIPSFLATLGTMGIARGIALTLTDTKTVVVYDRRFSQIWGGSEIFGVPSAVLWVLLFLSISCLLYYSMPFGNYVRAVGGNKTAARYSGINSHWIIIKVFTISGIFSAVGGLLMAGRLNAGRPEVGADISLDSIAAVILGGTLMSGGKGSVVKTLVGAIIMGCISNALIILGFQNNVQQIVKGSIVIIAVALNFRGE